MNNIHLRASCAPTVRTFSIRPLTRMRRVYVGAAPVHFGYLHHAKHVVIHTHLGLLEPTALSDEWEER